MPSPSSFDFASSAHQTRLYGYNVAWTEIHPGDRSFAVAAIQLSYVVHHHTASFVTFMLDRGQFRSGVRMRRRLYAEVRGLKFY